MRTYLTIRSVSLSDHTPAVAMLGPHCVLVPPNMDAECIADALERLARDIVMHRAPNIQMPKEESDDE